MPLSVRCVRFVSTDETETPSMLTHRLLCLSRLLVVFVCVRRQVLPFVLRREKGEVLAELPPKIITEMVCDLTPEQRRLHSMWERGGKSKEIAHARKPLAVTGCKSNPITQFDWLIPTGFRPCSLYYTLTLSR